MAASLLSLRSNDCPLLDLDGSASGLLAYNEEIHSDKPRRITLRERLRTHKTFTVEQIMRVIWQ